MIGGILFQIKNDQASDGHVTARIVDFLEIIGDRAVLEHANDPVLPYDRITIQITYPLKKALGFVAISPTQGFTRHDLFRAIFMAYEMVYAKPEEYGVWGHSLDQLFLEGAFVDKAKLVTLSVGS